MVTLMTGATSAWDELTEAEQEGVIQRTAEQLLDTPSARGWTPDHVRREDRGDSFMHRVADAMDAELAAREARKQLRIVASQRGWYYLANPPAPSDPPFLTVLEGYSPHPFRIALEVAQSDPPGPGCPPGCA